MKDAFSRRDIVTKVFPAATLVGMGLGGATAFAKEHKADEHEKKWQKSVVGKMMMEAYGNGQYQLPKLPYGYDALEPHIDSQTLQIHHDKHHQGYVDGLNSTVKALSEAGGGGDIDSAKLYGLERNLSFNAGGHALHTLFWATMAPKAGGKPEGKIAEAVNKGFGSFDSFKNYFTNVATNIKGSGWAVLAYEPIGDMLVVFGVHDHDRKLGPSTMPLLTVDVWEHAYYLKYQNKRGDFVKAWWNLVNWAAVDEAYMWMRSRFRGKPNM